VVLSLTNNTDACVFVVRKAFGKGKPGEDAHSAASVLRREYEKLGPITCVLYPLLWYRELTVFKYTFLLNFVL